LRPTTAQRAKIIPLTLVKSQLGLRKFGARWWLGLSCIIWGIVMMCMGFVKTDTALIGLRALLGVFEATLFPGAAL
jgi:sugar phosphate permease